MDTLVSIIIPSYNVERFLDKCIRSVLSQTYKTIEVIIVDDGSSDNTFCIAKQWEKRDKRIKAIHQENQGSGPARNTGLRACDGDYIVFVDPDDWIEEDLVFCLCKEMEMTKSDLIISGCIHESYQNEKLIETTTESFDRRVIVGDENIHGSFLKLFNEQAILAPTRIMYKKSIIDMYGVEFPNLRRSQDIVFNYRYYKHINSLSVLDKCLYHYRFDLDAISSKVKPDYYKSISFIFKDVKNLCAEWGIDIKGEDFHIFCKHFYGALLMAMSASESTKKIREILSDDGIHDYLKYMHSKAKTLKAKLFLNAAILKVVFLVKIGLSISTKHRR